MTKGLLSSHNPSPELAAMMHHVHHPGELASGEPGVTAWAMQLMEEACWWMENIWFVFEFRWAISLYYSDLYLSITYSDLLAWVFDTKVMWG